MSGTWRSAGLALLLALLLMPGIASAQLRRGDTGSEVAELQRLLLGTGWLFEEPDGVFGKRTEQAVRQYEAHAGLKVDGIADDALLASLRGDYLLLTGELPEGASAQEMTAPFCSHLTASDGSSAVVYCQAHGTLLETTHRLMDDGSAAKARQACALWREEIVRQYDQWIACTDESQHGGIAKARETFLAAMDAQEQAIAAYYGTFQEYPGDAAPYAALELQLRGHAAWLCALVSGALTGYDGPEL